MTCASFHLYKMQHLCPFLSTLSITDDETGKTTCNFRFFVVLPFKNLASFRINQSHFKNVDDVKAFNEEWNWDKTLVAALPHDGYGANGYSMKRRRRDSSSSGNVEELYS
jgi:hypothetical protein